MNDIGKCVQRRSELDRQHQLAEDLARSRRDERCADQDAAVAIGNELECAPVKIVDVATHALGRIGLAMTTSIPLARAAASDSPTDATSGSVNVTRGTAV